MPSCLKYEYINYPQHHFIINEDKENLFRSLWWCMIYFLNLFSKVSTHKFFIFDSFCWGEKMLFNLKCGHKTMEGQSYWYNFHCYKRPNNNVCIQFCSVQYGFSCICSPLLHAMNVRCVTLCGHETRNGHESLRIYESLLLIFKPPDKYQLAENN